MASSSSQSSSSTGIADDWAPGAVARRLAESIHSKDQFSQIFGSNLAGRLVKACPLTGVLSRVLPWQTQAQLCCVVAQLRIDDLEQTLKALFSQGVFTLPRGMTKLPIESSELADEQLLWVIQTLQGTSLVPGSIERAQEKIKEEMATAPLDKAGIHSTNKQLALNTLLSLAGEFRAAREELQGLATAEYLAHSLARLPLRTGMLIPALDPETGKLRLWVVCAAIDQEGFGAFFLVPRDRTLRKIIFLGRGTDPHNLKSVQGNLSKSAGSGRCKSFEKELQECFLKSMEVMEGEPFELSLYGHSQGGAICGVMLSRFLLWAHEAKQKISHCELITFMAPGVDKSHAREFAAAVVHHPDCQFSIVHAKVKGKKWSNKDPVPYLGGVPLGYGTKVPILFQTWESPTEELNAHRALIFFRNENQHCLRSYTERTELLEAIQWRVESLASHLSHSLLRSKEKYLAAFKSLPEPKEWAQTASELKDMVAKQKLKSLQVLQQLLARFAEMAEVKTPRAWEIIETEQEGLHKMLREQFKAEKKLRKKKKGTAHNKMGYFWDKTFGKAFGEVKHSSDQLTSPTSDAKRRFKGGSKLLVMSAAAIGATVIGGMGTAAVVGTSAVGAAVAGQVKDKWDEKKEGEAFQTEHAEAFELIALAQLALPVLKELS